jgi:hypothetical protein
MRRGSKSKKEKKPAAIISKHEKRKLPTSFLLFRADFEQCEHRGSSMETGEKTKGKSTTIEKTFWSEIAQSWVCLWKKYNQSFSLIVWKICVGMRENYDCVSEISFQK